MNRSKVLITMGMVFFVWLFSCSLWGQGQNCSLYTFDFLRSDTIPVQQRATDWSAMGYKGVCFGVRKASDIKKLKSYLATNEVKEGRFTIPVLFFPIEVQASGEWSQLWKKTLALSPTTSLWVIFPNRKKTMTTDMACDILSDMCAEAAKTGVDVVIYPHDNTFIESAEEAIPLISKVNKANLKISFHLSHELRAGNGDRLEEVARNVAPYLKYASISGSNRQMNPNANADWSDAIKPLDEGDFPTLEYLVALDNINFSSQMFLHTFGIEQAYKDHLWRSMNKWKSLIQALEN